MRFVHSVDGLQLTGVVLTSFRNGRFELSLQYDQAVCESVACTGLVDSCHSNSS